MEERGWIQGQNDVVTAGKLGHGQTTGSELLRIACNDEKSGSFLTRSFF
jgi:hypothetical protein